MNEIQINVYCDESNHLENDDSNIMTIGAVYAPRSKLIEINKRIREIKQRNGVSIDTELKWVKISDSRKQVYLDLIDYFFDDDDLSSRTVIIPNKSGLKHNDFKQTHDDWYYKMYFTMLKTIFDPNFTYNIYIDIKDTNTWNKSQNLLEVLKNNAYDFNGRMIRKIQPVRSNEIEIMQLVDILIGAIGYINRNLKSNPGKLAIIEKIKQRSSYTLTKNTLYRESKINLFVWDAAGDSREV